MFWALPGFVPLDAVSSDQKPTLITNACSDALQPAWSSLLSERGRLSKEGRQLEHSVMGQIKTLQSLYYCAMLKCGVGMSNSLDKRKQPKCRQTTHS